MRVAYRDVSDETPLPDVDMIHYFLDDEYLFSVRDHAFAVVQETPVWPNVR